MRRLSLVDSEEKMKPWERVFAVAIVVVFVANVMLFLFNQYRGFYLENLGFKDREYDWGQVINDDLVDEVKNYDQSSVLGSNQQTFFTPTVTPDIAQSETSNQITANSLNVLVDKSHALPQDYSPTDLVSLSSYNFPGAAHQKLRREAAENLVQMRESANSSGVDFAVLSGYRSYQDQVYTYNKWVQEYGSAANQTSAKAGHSEHQLGTTVDLVLPGGGINSIYPGSKTKEWSWLDQNAHKYGFVMSYRYRQEAETGYSFEPWHWRYVGVELATKIRRSTATPQSHYLPLD